MCATQLCAATRLCPTVPASTTLVSLLPLDPPLQGELAVRGPGLFREYWGRAEATAAAFDQQGFFLTGDTVSLEGQPPYYKVCRARQLPTCCVYSTPGDVCYCWLLERKPLDTSWQEQQLAHTCIAHQDPIMAAAQQPVTYADSDSITAARQALDFPLPHSPLWFPCCSTTATTAPSCCSLRLQIQGRTSVDIIKSGGFKLSALDIENTLLSHPGVSEAAVLGVPDEAMGQVGGVVVSLSLWGPM